MPKLAANLSTLYTESPFIERFTLAGVSGFHFVEFQFPYEHDISHLASALERNGLTPVLFNLPSGNWSAGERGIAALPDRIQEFREGIARAMEIARVLHVQLLNCLVGLRDPQIPLQDQKRVMFENLAYAVRTLEANGITTVIEMLNPHDRPGFLIPTPKEAFAVQEESGLSNLKIQYDIYHAQRVEGELASTLQENLARIGHIQIADNPGRHEPGTGEINYRFLLNWLDRIGYLGFVGLEYNPATTTEESLTWIREYGFTL